MDVIPYTLAEIQAGQPLAAEALRTGKVLWARAGGDLTRPVTELDRHAKI